MEIGQPLTDGGNRRTISNLFGPSNLNGLIHAEASVGGDVG